MMMSVNGGIGSVNVLLKLNRHFKKMQAAAFLIFHIVFYRLQIAIYVKSNQLHSRNHLPVDKSHQRICKPIPILVYCK
jgi:hypothetical protein